MRRWFTNLLTKYRTAAWITWAVVVFILHAIPGTYVPAYDWAEFISIDKWIHAAMFFSGYVVLRGEIRFKAILIFAIMGYALLLEIYQMKIASERSFDWLDLVADGCGVTLGLIFL